MADISKALTISGWMEEAELQWLAEQASSRSSILEIGCYMGRSTRAFADNTDGKVLVIDDFLGPRDSGSWNPLTGHPYTEEERQGIFSKFEENLSDHLDSGKVQVLKMDFSKVEEYFSERNIKPDLVFIDGDHSYEAVSRDIKYWKKRIVSGGLLCGHDSPYPPVSKAINELVPGVQLVQGTYIWYSTITK